MRQLEATHRPPGPLNKAELKAMSAEEIQQWVRANQPRRFLAAELLYSWTVEPEKWEDVPFLYAAGDKLRRDVLGVPLRGEDGSRLTHVSPRQLRSAEKFRAILMEIGRLQDAARPTGKPPKYNALQAEANELYQALAQFDHLSYVPGGGDGRRWLEGDVSSMWESWAKFRQDLPQLPVFEPQPKMLGLVQRTDLAMMKLADAYRPMQTSPPSLARSDEDAAELRRLTTDLAAEVDAFAKSKVPDSAGLSQEEIDEIIGDRQAVARSARSIALQAAKIQWGLYDAEGEGLFIVPALEPTTLEADRHRSEIHPWISLYGSWKDRRNYCRAIRWTMCGKPARRGRPLGPPISTVRPRPSRAVLHRYAGVRRPCPRDFRGDRTTAAKAAHHRARQGLAGENRLSPPHRHRRRGDLQPRRSVPLGMDRQSVRGDRFGTVVYMPAQAAFLLPERECKRSREQELHRTHRQHCHLRRHLRAHHPEIHSQNSA